MTGPKQADYKVRAYNTSGVLQAELTDFSGLSYTKTVNSAGLLLLPFRGDHSILTSLVDKWYFDVYRRPYGGTWTLDFASIYRQPRWTFGKDGPVVVLYCPGIMSMLGWRHVLYYAGYADRSKFTSEKDETILKTIVDYNCGSNATTGNGRERTGTITGISIESDSARGNTIDHYCYGKNVLETIKEVAKVGQGDFDLIKTSPTTFQFRYYLTQRGTNRIGTLRFSLEFGNMANPVYVPERIHEKTIAFVAGKGEGADRETVIRSGENYSASNNIEMFVNATDIDYGDTTGLQDRGDAKLDEVVAREKFNFDVIETPSTRYGVDWFFGDRGEAINPFTGATNVVINKSVRISLDNDGQENIVPEFVEYIIRT